MPDTEIQDNAVSERMREARETVAAARSAMEKAESALRAGEKAAQGATAAKRHPVLTAVGTLATLGLAALVIALIQRD